MTNRWVYFVQRSDGGPIKIGIARDVADRVGALQTSHAVRLTVLATCPGDDALESWLHNRLHKFRLEGEWFEPSPEVLGEVQHALTLPQAKFRLKQPRPRTAPAPLKKAGPRDDRLGDLMRKTFPAAMFATGLSDKEFSKTFGVGMDTVRLYRTGKRVPSIQSTMDMAKISPAISYWGRMMFAADPETMAIPEDHPLLKMTPQGDAEYVRGQGAGE